MSIAQEIFLVLFSILYGVMLQSLAKPQSFPLGRIIRGFVGRNTDGEPIWTRKEFWECERVFREENHISFGEFDEQQITTYKKGLLDMWRKRLIWSVFLLNVLPIIYFGFTFFLLGTRYWFSITFNGNIEELWLIGIIFLSALGVFGFYRLHHALIAGKWKSLFCDVAKKIEARGTSFDYRANFLWGFLYILSPLVPLILLASFQ